MGVIEYRIISVVVFVVCILIFVFPVRRKMARNYVLQNKGALVDLLIYAEGTVTSPRVSRESKRALDTLRHKISAIERIHAFSRGVDWKEVRKRMGTLEASLREVVSEMEKELGT